MRRQCVPDPVTLAAATWLACGIVLLGLTPLPLRNASLGWSPAFWLLAAPALLLIARHAIAQRRLPTPLRRKARSTLRARVQAIRHQETRSTPSRRVPPARTHQAVA